MASTPTSTIMNGVSRFLSRRDKRTSSKRNKSRIVTTDVYGVFSSDDAKKGDKEEEAKVKQLLKQLHVLGITTLKESQIEYALRLKTVKGDVDKALELLVMFEESLEGIVREYDPSVKLLGAENRESVTCYLDALLFAMFARLDSFEAMLFYDAPDEPRKRLAALLRLWVNMLRTGKLITVDLTKHLQEALASCGWDEAREIRQQDTSEAFTFITGKLELPLLTLKMDIYHTGKEDANDDHKFVNERLLEVAIPPEAPEGGVITLEDCLETYFNNKIEVKRHLQRRNTLRSIKSTDTGKGDTTHIETVELDSGSNTPLTPTAPALPQRPVSSRHRTDSIFSERYIDSSEISEKKLMEEMEKSSVRPRGGSIRKEVMMPAWQFFSLIPWYTDNAPTNDVQVAAHFSSKRPVLGICLKRYTMLPNGTPQRLGTYVDIPLEIGLPHFISDDRLEEEGPLFGNFKLSLQSVVCHRGVSVDSGHYISLVRTEDPGSPSPSTPRDENMPRSEKDDALQWMRFDDLAEERVTYVDIHKALREESPYLLFYQVRPIDDGDFEDKPPSYAEANSFVPTANVSSENLPIDAEAIAINTTMVDPTISDVTDWDQSGGIDLSGLEKDDLRGRTSMSSNHRSSVTFDEGSANGSAKGNTAPTTPADDTKTSFLSASRRGSIAGLRKKSRSRPSSQSGENRLSFTMSRLTGRMSKDRLSVPNEPATSDDGTSSIANSNTEGRKSIDVLVTAPTKEKSSSGTGYSKAKKEKKDKDHRRHRSLSRQPLAAAMERRKNGVPDRECTIM